MSQALAYQRVVSAPRASGVLREDHTHRKFRFRVTQAEENEVIGTCRRNDLREIYGELPAVARPVQLAKQSDHRHAPVCMHISTRALGHRA